MSDVSDVSDVSEAEVAEFDAWYEKFHMALPPEIQRRFTWLRAKVRAQVGDEGPRAFVLQRDEDVSGVSDDGCTHESASGRDRADMDNPLKVWKCDECGWQYVSLTTAGISHRVGLAEAVRRLENRDTALRESHRKVSYLNVVQFYRLEHACRIIVDGLGHPPYLVGSSTERPDYRDVDLRSILPDDEFDALFGGRVEFWSLFCLGVGTYLTEVSGLPIDYQVQRQTEANEKFGGKERNPMGHGFRNYAGGGDATGV